MNQTLSSICTFIHDLKIPIQFSILEIGAVPLGDKKEPFYQLIEEFPGSRITAFEVDKELCEKLNSQVNNGITFYPVALGEKEGNVDFYETNHPMCCSLYEPNHDLIKAYNNLDVACLKEKSSIEVQSLDHFLNSHNILGIDFIKIDIQGAELDVFKGGIKTLKNVIGIVSEVEFISIYKNQPLFGDVDRFLQTHQFMFHKFLGLAGRALQPIVLNNNPNIATQHMWSDAFFIKALSEIPRLKPEQQIKLGLLAFIYGSPDLAFFCFNEFDKKSQTSLAKDFMTIF